jgi:hypothetical protein
MLTAEVDDRLSADHSHLLIRLLPFWEECKAIA